MGKLTPKQKAFCEEYIIDFNATQASIRSGYSKKTANRLASRMLSNVDIQSYIQELQQKREERTEITADMVVKELGKVAFLNLEDFYKENGELKEPYELSQNAKSALASYHTKRVKLGDEVYIDVPNFKAYDKMKAIELLMKHLGMFNDKEDEDNNIKQPINITFRQINKQEFEEIKEENKEK